MKRFCFLAVLLLLSSSADAGGYSFSIGGHRIHIESSRYCRSTSCASVSISGIDQSRGKRDHYDDDVSDSLAPAKVPAAPTQTVSPLPAPASRPAVPPAAAVPPPAVFKPAASATQPAVAPPPRPPAPPAAIAPPPRPDAPPVERPAEVVRPAPAAAPQVSRVSHQVEEEPADTPVGDWQTEGKGMVRIAECGRALCGYVLNTSSNDKGEAVLINMKSKTDRQWTGSVYSRDSGDTYYGTMDMKGANTLRVEACALGRFYCSGNNWKRITPRNEPMITSRQTTPEPRS